MSPIGQASTRFVLVSLGSGGLERTEFVREATQNGFASWSFHKAVDGDREQNENNVGEPGVEGGEMKALGDVVNV